MGTTTTYQPCERCGGEGAYYLLAGRHGPVRVGDVCVLNMPPDSYELIEPCDAGCDDGEVEVVFGDGGPEPQPTYEDQYGYPEVF